MHAEYADEHGVPQIVALYLFENLVFVLYIKNSDGDLYRRRAAPARGHAARWPGPSRQGQPRNRKRAAAPRPGLSGCMLSRPGESLSLSMHCCTHNHTHALLPRYGVRDSSGVRPRCECGSRSNSCQALDHWRRASKEMVVSELLELLGHQHALRARDDAHIVDKEDRGQPIDLEHRGHLGLLV